jgi:oxygen-dependent protoporphyrinogen oxidase
MLSLKSAFPSLREWEKEYGSVLRGAMNSRKVEPGPRPTLSSFRGGMKALTDALARNLGGAFVPGAQAESIARSSAASGYTIRITQGAQREELTVQSAVLASPAYISGHLVEGMSANLSKCLLGVPYAPVAVIGHGYKRHQIAHSLIGFGVLIPRKEGLATLGTVWNSSLFPGCAPEDSVLLTSFVGGATDPGIVRKEPAEISSIVERETGKILGISGPPIATQVWRYDKGLPQYNIGHAHILSGIKDELAKLPGLFLAGNYLAGPALGNCVEASTSAAVSVQSYLAGRPQSAPQSGISAAN